MPAPGVVYSRPQTGCGSHGRVLCAHVLEGKSFKSGCHSCALQGSSSCSTSFWWLQPHPQARSLQSLPLSSQNLLSLPCPVSLCATHLCRDVILLSLGLLLTPCYGLSVKYIPTGSCVCTLGSPARALFWKAVESLGDQNLTGGSRLLGMGFLSVLFSVTAKW